jgi:hypothetical protein
MSASAAISLLRITLVLMMPACASTTYDLGCPVPAASLLIASRATTMAVTPSPTPTVTTSRPATALAPRNVIIVTIDGVRWQEVFGGVDGERARRAHLPACTRVDAATLLPNLHRHFFDGGVVVGAPGRREMVASGPNFVSLPGYREIFTGRASSCSSNFCDFISEPTVVDELRAHERLAAGDIAVISSWRNIERAATIDPRTVAISAGRHGGATRDQLRVSAAAGRDLDAGRGASAYPGWIDYRPDRFTAQLALDYLAVRRPRFLFVGLGDTDEYAHRSDYAGYVASLRAADRFIGQLMAELAQLGDYGAETAVIVTTDHGRAANFSGHGGGAPESQRVWLLAAGAGLPAHGFGDGERAARLADIAPTVRRWLGLADDRAAGAGRPMAALVRDAAEGTLVAGASR